MSTAQMKSPAEPILRPNPARTSCRKSSLFLSRDPLRSGENRLDSGANGLEFLQGLVAFQELLKILQRRTQQPLAELLLRQHVADRSVPVADAVIAAYANGEVEFALLVRLDPNGHDERTRDL